MKYDKETLSQFDIIQLCCLSNIQSGNAIYVVVFIFLSIIAILASPALWLKLIGALVGIGWVICAIVICVRLDRIGDVLEKKYNEQKSQRKEEGGNQ